eukprot:CAMPEP_0177669072 /NCGR_PEP_ID=MMETSP0447-20121125/23203_1 /TAXON_ID=0 /ORGANISM="Stygamoeba regulata, Strain BSH-02190019" /LENGTH=458 /DNA_ID=CAMNT_0019175829 /DNA_START=90 /DNA_END=1467 /DNA_ORIENTATION=+
MLTIDELKVKVEAGEIDTVCMAFTDHHGRLVGKRYDADFFLESGAVDGSHACNYLLTCDMEMTPRDGFSFANWEKGYGDVHMVPDLNSLRVAAWLPKTAYVLCDVFDGATHKPAAPAPRSVLTRQVAEAEKEGFCPLAASELEYHAYKESYSQAHKMKFSGLTPMGSYLEDYHMLQGTRFEILNHKARIALKHSGIPVENSKGEAGFGQHELNVKYSDIVTMCDRHAIYKQCLKEIADQLGMSVTFMSKVSTDDTGSGCHLHLSLWDRDVKENMFSHDPSNDKDVPLQIPGSSQYFRWFLGGWMQHCQDVMLFYAPTINSYKRYVSSSWAPTRIATSVDNRTAGFRIVGKGKSLRIECRIPGADVNPYLAFAASLASGIDGIRNRTEPPAVFEGDIYQARQLPQVPMTMKAALTGLRRPGLHAKRLGTTWWTTTPEHELVEYERAVTDWERRRYFEQI